MENIPEKKKRKQTRAKEHTKYFESRPYFTSTLTAKAMCCDSICSMHKKTRERKKKSKKREENEHQLEAQMLYEEIVFPDPRTS